MNGYSVSGSGSNPTASFSLCRIRVWLIIIAVVRKLLLVTMLIYQYQVLEVRFHDAFLLGQLRELLAVLIYHVQSSIQHANLLA